MPVKIENMKMPESCCECKFCQSDGLERKTCRLTDHNFPASDVFCARFATCPLKECVYMKKQKAVKIICHKIVDQKYKTWYDKAEAAWEALMATEK